MDMDRRLVLSTAELSWQAGWREGSPKGCSWVVYKLRLGRAWSGQPLHVAVHAWLPEGVTTEVHAWVVRRWWREDARPTGDGYFAEAPS